MACGHIQEVTLFINSVSKRPRNRSLLKTAHQKDGDLIGPIVRNSKVHLTVTVEVTRREAERIPVDCETVENRRFVAG